jgi:hypothetical protein
LPIHPTERAGRGGLGKAGTATGGRGVTGGGGYCGQYGTAGGAYGYGYPAGRSASSRSSAVRSVETLAIYCEIAAKSEESRAITARCGSVMPDMVSANPQFPDV